MGRVKERRSFRFEPAMWTVCALIGGGTIPAPSAVAEIVENLGMSQSVPDHMAFDSALATWFSGEKTGKGISDHVRVHLVAEAIDAEPTKAGAARVSEVTARFRALRAKTERERNERRADIYCSGTVEKAPYRTLVDTSDRMDIENEVLDRQQFEAGLASLTADERVAMRAYLRKQKQGISFLHVSIADQLEHQYPQMSEEDRREYVYANLLEKCAAANQRLQSGEGS